MSADTSKLQAAAIRELCKPLRKPPRNLLILRRGILEGDFVRGLGLGRSLRESLKHSAPVACPWPLLSGADGPGLVLGACSRSRPLHGPPNPVPW
jgi:hypothetical protein